VVRFEVIYTQWATEDGVFQGGVHELTSDTCPCGVKHGKPSAALLGLLGAAEAAGSIVVLEASDQHRARLDKAVQSQADGEAAYAKAVESGEWHEGNRLQFELDVAAGVRDGSLNG
jgi:hypothetical protein